MFTRQVITVVLAAITALTFASGFGNVWALGRSLRVPPFAAPLVGPAVGLSAAAAPGCAPSCTRTVYGRTPSHP